MLINVPLIHAFLCFAIDGQLELFQFGSNTIVLTLIFYAYLFVAMFIHSIECIPKSRIVDSEVYNLHFCQ